MRISAYDQAPGSHNTAFRQQLVADPFTDVIEVKALFAGKLTHQLVQSGDTLVGTG